MKWRCPAADYLVVLTGTMMAPKRVLLIFKLPEGLLGF